jgi:hypothetical protein
MTYTWLGSTCVPSVAAMTLMLLVRDSSAGRKLSCFGARCCTTTKAMESSLMLLSSAVSASSPPAEAPMPTMKKLEPVSACWPASSDPTSSGEVTAPPLLFSESVSSDPGGAILSAASTLPL